MPSRHVLKSDTLPKVPMRLIASPAETELPAVPKIQRKLFNGKPRPETVVHAKLESDMLRAREQAEAAKAEYERRSAGIIGKVRNLVGLGHRGGGGDDEKCPICGREDKPEDFRECKKCHELVCESCVNKQHVCTNCVNTKSDIEKQIKKAKKVLEKAIIQKGKADEAVRVARKALTDLR
jgi:hypothetical protein